MEYEDAEGRPPQSQPTPRAAMCTLHISPSQTTALEYSSHTRWTKPRLSIRLSRLYLAGILRGQALLRRETKLQSHTRTPILRSHWWASHCRARWDTF